jgi:predicted amidophosphoribosyltransferase
MNGRVQRRLRREGKTLEAMVRLFCHGMHGSRETLCGACRELLDYAERRLQACPLQAEKPSCFRCTVHCYSVPMRERVKAVMRYAGPRMIRKHPLLALMHLLDERRGNGAPSPQP